MTVTEAQSCYREFTAKASDLVRQLAFAALAIIWIFRTEHPGSPTHLPHSMLWPGCMIVLALLFDFLQYVCAAMLYGFIARLQEKRLPEPDSAFDLPREVNWPAIACFWAKVGCLASAYVMLLTYTFRQFF